MKLRIAILAACAGMLLASPDHAQAGEPIAGVDTKLPKNVGGIRTKPAPKKFQKKSSRTGPDKPAIFDRWGNQRR